MACGFFYSTLRFFLLSQFLCILANVHCLNGSNGLNGQRKHC